jgi:hypothetical protein
MDLSIQSFPVLVAIVVIPLLLEWAQVTDPWLRPVGCQPNVSAGAHRRTSNKRDNAPGTRPRNGRRDT